MMRTMVLGLSLLVVIAAGAASGQGYYDRVYRGASPDPTDNRYDARPSPDNREAIDRAVRARRKADEDEPVVNTGRGSGGDADQCDSRRVDPNGRGC